MKVRRFYPRQVLRALAGREVTGLHAGEQCALCYFMRRSRKLGQPIFIVNAAADLSQLKHASPEQIRAVLENTSTKIFLSMPPATV
jgi:hypothetical protein